MRYMALVLLILSGCTMNWIRVHSQNGSTTTVDTSVTENAQVDPTISIPPLKSSKIIFEKSFS